MKRGVSGNSGILFAPRSRVSRTVHVCSKLKHPLLVAREIPVSVNLPSAAGVMGKWESHGVGGIPKRGGKGLPLGLFHGASFSQPVAPAIALTMIGGTAQPSACGLCPSQHNGRAGRHRIVIANEAARFWRVIGTKIVCPTKSYGLIPQLGFNPERTLHIAKRHRVPYQTPRAGKVGIVRGFPDNCNILFGSIFPKPRG